MHTQHHILCLHGPNLNLLGTRETHLYGAQTLEDINTSLQDLAVRLGVQLTCRQSNHEGVLIDWLHQARAETPHTDALIINPAGLTHTSVSLRDAVIALGVPTFEVHISNVYKREPFRHTSFFADISTARLMGFGPEGYGLALRGAVMHLHQQTRSRSSTG